MVWVTICESKLDGRPAQVKRLRTSLFSFTAAEDLKHFDGCLTGSPQLGVADGYFVLMEPLRPGEPTLDIHSKLPGLNLETDGHYQLNVSRPRL